MPGVQILFALPAHRPVRPGLRPRSRTSRRDVYFVTLLAAALSTTCLIAPSAAHRLRFHQGERPWLIEHANRHADRRPGLPRRRARRRDAAGHRLPVRRRRASGSTPCGVAAGDRRALVRPSAHALLPRPSRARLVARRASLRRRAGAGASPWRVAVGGSASCSCRGGRSPRPRGDVRCRLDRCSLHAARRSDEDFVPHRASQGARRPGVVRRHAAPSRTRRARPACGRRLRAAGSSRTWRGRRASWSRARLPRATRRRAAGVTRDPRAPAPAPGPAARGVRARPVRGVLRTGPGGHRRDGDSARGASPHGARLDGRAW